MHILLEYHIIWLSDNILMRGPKGEYHYEQQITFVS